MSFYLTDESRASSQSMFLLWLQWCHFRQGYHSGTDLFLDFFEHCFLNNTVQLFYLTTPTYLSFFQCLFFWFVFLLIDIWNCVFSEFLLWFWVCLKGTTQEADHDSVTVSGFLLRTLICFESTMSFYLCTTLILCKHKCLPMIITQLGVTAGTSSTDKTKLLTADSWRSI